MKKLLLSLFLLTTMSSVAQSALFSVAADKQVTFAPGNLQFHTGDSTWRFAPEQYSVIGEQNIHLGDPAFSGWIDMFGWSTTSNYYGVNPSNSNTDYTGEFVDWGTLFEGDWYTPSMQEWYYLLNTRENAAALQQLAYVDTILGVLLFPDDWTMPADINVSPALDEDDVPYYSYTLDQWTALESAGAIFLPAAGRRTGGYGNMINRDQQVETDSALLINGGFYRWHDNRNHYCYYWTSTQKENATVYYLINIRSLGNNQFTEGLPILWSEMGRYGQSVRLACEYQSPMPEPEDPQTVVLKYLKATTTNMQEGNNASALNLDSILFNLTAEKGSHNLLPGLNKDGTIRMYASKSDANGNAIHVALSNGLITSITLHINTEVDHEVYAGDTKLNINQDNTYAINAASFAIKNISTLEKDNQLRLDSISITYQLSQLEPELGPEPAVQSGVFSVGEDKTIKFAPSNILFHTGDSTWRFAPEQYTVIGEQNIHLGDPAFSGWIDMFGWSTTSNYYGVNPSNSNTDYTGEFVDWGTLFEGDWYTPSMQEWYYLLNTRENADALQQLAYVDTILGVLLFPDEWITPADVDVSPELDEDDVPYYSYTLDQWAILESAGAIFLPAAGRRTGGYGNMINYNQVKETDPNRLINGGFYRWHDNRNHYCYYWTSTQKENATVYYLINIRSLGNNQFTEGLPILWSEKGRYGQSVRLAFEYVEPTPEPDLPTSLDETEMPNNVQKIMHNGQIIILRDNKRFNLLGTAL